MSHFVFDCFQDTVVVAFHLDGFEVSVNQISISRCAVGRKVCGDALLAQSQLLSAGFQVVDILLHSIPDSLEFSILGKSFSTLEKGVQLLKRNVGHNFGISKTLVVAHIAVNTTSKG